MPPPFNSNLGLSADIFLLRIRKSDVFTIGSIMWGGIVMSMKQQKNEFLKSYPLMVVYLLKVRVFKSNTV